MTFKKFQIAKRYRIGVILIAIPFFVQFQHSILQGEETAPRREVNQSHLKHMTEADLRCVDCHPGAEQGTHAGMPDMDVCADCHTKDTDDSLSDQKGCLKCHTFAEPNPKCTIDHCNEDDLPEIASKLGPEPFPIRYSSEKSEGGFSHRIHFKNNVRCYRCHGDIAKEGRIPFPSGKYMPNANLCFNCHSKNFDGFTHKNHLEREIKCTECHGKIGSEDRRPFPKGTYIPNVEKECRICHKPVSPECKTCHPPEFQDKSKPGNHTSEMER